MAQVTIESQGRRHYLRGLPYSLRGLARDEGCKWDAEAKAWWTGKRERAEEIAGAANAQSDEPETLDPDARVVIGRAKYRGRSYWALWYGTTRNGDRAAKLAFRDGSRVFWSGADFTIEREYQSARSINELREYAERVRGENCAECGRAPGTIEAADSSGLRAMVCTRCAQAPSYERSFA